MAAENVAAGGKFPAGTASAKPSATNPHPVMNSIIWIIGAVVVIIVILKVLGLY